jgi:hypothetical protein
LLAKSLAKGIAEAGGLLEREDLAKREKEGLPAFIERVVLPSMLKYRVALHNRHKDKPQKLHPVFKEGTPCRHCRDGLHRICEAPIPIPTILAYLRGAKNLPTVTLACCDRKEFWTQPVYT